MLLLDQLNVITTNNSNSGAIDSELYTNNLGYRYSYSALVSYS